MAFLLPIVLKIFWWVLPRVAGQAVDKLGHILGLVEAANTLVADSAQRRAHVLGELRELLPMTLSETFLRWVVEFCVLLNRLGVEERHLNKIEDLVAVVDLKDLTATEKRGEVIGQFLGLFPDCPEYVARMLAEFAVMKLRAGLLKVTGGTPVPPTEGAN